MTLESLAKGKMKDMDFPLLGDSYGSKDDKPQEIVVFMIGGVTFEEARFVAQINGSGNGLVITLGGTSIVNSTVFLQELFRNCWHK